jgi:hypothetical protein
MNEKRLRWLVTTLLFMVVVTMGGGILFIYQQFPDLDSYDDTVLGSQSLRSDYALSLCLVTIIRSQTLYTTESDGVIWQRTSEQWQAGESKILGNGGEAQYQREILPFINIRSRLFFQSARPHNTVFVNDQVVIQLPEWLCHPSDNSWHDTPTRHVPFY